MIRGCFRHLTGIGPRTAEALSGCGFATWEDCMANENTLPFNGKRRKRFLAEVSESASALGANDIRYFTSSFPAAEQWRILNDYFGAAAFIDVETTGLSRNSCHASVIAAYYRGELHSFVYGENLDDFLSFADGADLIVTFNGSSFDIPFIEKTFNIPSLDRPHVDLRWVAWHRGFRGGLKSIERQMGIRRPSRIEGIDGFEAVDLFYKWQAGDREARESLITYCEADVIATSLVAERLLAMNNAGRGVSDPAEAFQKLA